MHVHTHTHRHTPASEAGSPDVLVDIPANPQMPSFPDATQLRGNSQPSGILYLASEKIEKAPPGSVFSMNIRSSNFLAE